MNFALRSSVRNIPQTASLLFGAVTDSLPDSGATGTWTPLYTTDARLLTVRAGTPSTAIVGGVKWVSNSYASGDGYQFGGTYWDGTGQHPIACSGASIVATVCPTRTAGGSWSEIVDIFYSTLGLSVKDDTGEIQVRRNPAGSIWGTGYFIPDGQKTIVGLVVQPTGEFVVYANGNQIYADTSTTDVTSLIPGTTQYAGGNAQGAFGTYINVGRNNPDSWTTYNGKIGDVFVYTTALGDPDRQTLESDLKNKFDIVTHTITASAGANGAISPAGAYNVVHGANQTYTIARTSATTWPTFWLMAHLSALKRATRSPTLRLTKRSRPALPRSHSRSTRPPVLVEASSPSGAVLVDYGGSQAFAISPDPGYAIVDVLVDGTNNPAAVNSGSYTFTNVTANHTITASFVDNIPPTVTNVTSSLADGTYTLGKTIDVEVTFSEPVNVVITGGVPSILLKMDVTNRSAAYVSGSGTDTLRFEYTVVQGDLLTPLDYVDTTALNLNGGTIKDAAGNNAVLRFPRPVMPVHWEPTRTSLLPARTSSPVRSSWRASLPPGTTAM